MKRISVASAPHYVMIYTRQCEFQLTLDSDNPIFTSRGPWNLEMLDARTFRARDELTDQLIELSRAAYRVSERKARLARSRRAL